MRHVLFFNKLVVSILIYFFAMVLNPFVYFLNTKTIMSLFCAHKRYSCIRNTCAFVNKQVAHLSEFSELLAVGLDPTIRS